MAVGQEARFIAPIEINYSGLDASRNRIDMGQLGQSLQGAARLIGVASHIAMHAEYTNRAPSFAFRVLTEPARPGSYAVWAVLQTVIPALPLILEIPPPDLVEKIVNYILARLGGAPKDEKTLELLGLAIEANREAIAANRDIALAAMDATRESSQQLGQVALAAIEAVREAAKDQRAAARQFAVPVGQSAGQAYIGNVDSAFVIDQKARTAIDYEPPTKIGDASRFIVKLSELDIQTGHSKVEIQGQEGNTRLQCSITDPIVHDPESPYSAALHGQSWLTVVAKPHLRNGEVYKLTVSDTDSRS